MSKQVKVPAVGSRWIWEIDKPHARELIEVVEVKWNGEEWWIKTKGLMRDLEAFPSPREWSWNDLDRFVEAVTPVGAARHGAWKPASPNRPTE